MANRTFEQFQLSLERKVVKLFAKVKFDGTNWNLVTSETLFATTNPIDINPSLGIESMAASATPALVFKLGANNGGVPTYDSYIRLLSVNSTIKSSTAAVTAVAVVAEDVAGSSGNPSLSVTTTLSGSEASGDVLLFEITLSNTSAY